MPLVKAPVRNAIAAPPAPPPLSFDDALAQIESAIGSERRAAVHVLETRPAGIAALCARFPAEKAPSVREAILAALIRRRSPEVVAAMLPLLRSEQPLLRNSALEALAAMPDEVAPHVDALLQDPCSDVRIFTANLLSVLPHPRACEWLLVALADDHQNVAAAAIDGLAEIGDPSAVGPLHALCARFPDNEFIAFAARIALDRIGGC